MKTRTITTPPVRQPDPLWRALLVAIGVLKPRMVRYTFHLNTEVEVGRFAGQTPFILADHERVERFTIEPAD